MALNTFFWIPVGTKQGSARRSVVGLIFLSMPPRMISTKLVMLLQNTGGKKVNKSQKHPVEYEKNTYFHLQLKDSILISFVLIRIKISSIKTIKLMSMKQDKQKHFSLYP